MKFILTSIFFLSVLILNGQSVKGKVYSGGRVLIGAHVFWKGTTIGVMTSAKGGFTLNRTSEQDTLVVSHLGYRKLELFGPRLSDDMKVTLEQETEYELDGIDIEAKTQSKQAITLSGIQTERITTRELKKAACCNLSESFETNPSVDVNFADAVSGSKRVRLLGLDGIYSLITVENMPEVRGLSSAYGLTSIPGPWIESIQLSKGVGSVVNGYEAVTGQINVELKKPESAPRLHFNGYGNNVGRYETSLNSAFRLNEKWSTLILLHVNSMQNDIDQNKDGFLDIPRVNQITASNRWQYYNGKIESAFGIEVFTEDRMAGEIDFDPSTKVSLRNPWGLMTHQDRVNGYWKLGFVPPENHPERSLGIINKYSYYKVDGHYGVKFYTGANQYWHSNVIFQDRLISKEHLLKLGGSFFYDQYDEVLQDLLNDDLQERERTEVAIGTFAEYTYHPNERFTFIAGGRLDDNNLFGLIATPRLHLRYKLKKNLTWRFATGSGQRTPNPFVDHTRLIVSSRRIVLTDDLQQEKAWNFGTSLVYEKNLLGRIANVTFDLYHTDFVNRLVMDMDQDLYTVSIYNLNGRSYATVGQLEMNYEILKRLDGRVSYKIQDVKTTFNSDDGGDLDAVPFVATRKFLANMSYATKGRRWVFDVTTMRTTPGRLSKSIDLDGFDTPRPFWLLNAQASFNIKGFELYLGGENLTAFVQENPIISSDDPFNESFDAANIWAPVFGRTVYLGFRFTLY